MQVDGLTKMPVSWFSGPEMVLTKDAPESKWDGNF